MIPTRAPPNVAVLAKKNCRLVEAPSIELKYRVISFTCLSTIIFGGFIRRGGFW